MNKQNHGWVNLIHSSYNKKEKLIIYIMSQNSLFPGMSKPVSQLKKQSIEVEYFLFNIKIPASYTSHGSTR